MTRLGLLHFPGGRPPSKRWRPIAVIIVRVIVVAAGFGIWNWRPSTLVAPDDRATFNVGPLINAASTLVAPSGVVIRFRHFTSRSPRRWPG